MNPLLELQSLATTVEPKHNTVDNRLPWRDQLADQPFVRHNTLNNKLDSDSIVDCNHSIVTVSSEQHLDLRHSFHSLQQVDKLDGVRSSSLFLIALSMELMLFLGSGLKLREQL